MRMLFLGGGFLWALFCSPGVRAQITFIENRNQWSRDVDFGSRIPGGKMFIGAGILRYFFLDYEKLESLHLQSHSPQPDGAVHDDLIRGHAVFVTMEGADRLATPQTFGRSDEYYNYFLGNDPGRWASRAFAYDGMVYHDLYPGIDLKLYGSGTNVKYDFVVAPNADPSQIRIRYDGAEDLSLVDGDLLVTTPLAVITEKRPIAWQFVDGAKADVPCAFRLEGNIVSLVFPQGFDPCYELVIDPLLIFSTYSGSTADNWGSTATPGEHGNLYSAGVTEESAGGKFPATAGAFQVSSGGLYDIGILKYDSLGSNLLYATYLGGSNSESPHSLVMNGDDELILLGTTSSSDFPTTDGAFDRTFNGGLPVDWVVGYSYDAGSDLVISRFSTDGRALLASTYIGGSKNDGLNPHEGDLSTNYGDQVRGDIITDEEGNVTVSSVAESDDLPFVSSFNTTYRGGATDAVVFRMDKELSSLQWGAYIGGSGTDAAHTLKLDGEKNVFLAGGTTSADFPVTTGAYQTAYAGAVDGWIAKVAFDGSSVLHATFTGTDNYNQIYFLDINASEEVYVYGQTAGLFPVTAGVYHEPGSGQFVQKFNNALDNLIFSTVFGAGRGIPDISPTAFLVNDCNNLYMAGWGGQINSNLGFWPSSTHGMSTTPDAYQQSTSGSDFYFIVLTEDAKERLYATFLGGGQSRTHVDGGTSRFDKGGIVYHSVCSGCTAFNPEERATSDFPTTPGAWSQTNNSINCNNAAFKFDLSSLKARLRTNSVRRDMPGLDVICIPDEVVFENVSIGGEIFEWHLGDGPTITTTDTVSITHAYAAPGQYPVKLIAYDKGTCKAIDSAMTRITVNIATSFVQDDDDLCFGDSYQLRAGGASTYGWTNNADAAFFSGEAMPLVSPQDTTVYYVRLQEESGCVRRDTVQLNVVPAITPAFDWRKLPDCVARPRIAVQNLTDSLWEADRVFFDFGDGTTSDAIEDEHFFEKDGVYTIRLIAQREFCVYEQAISIPVFEMLIPNVITPGVPGHNDVFTIRYGEHDGVTPSDYGFKVDLAIYNRWGEEVYHDDTYAYDWSGEGLAAGVYYYEVTVEAHATCKGWLHLVR